ncbi:MAG: acyltransferase family protein [Muribaculaceae bacterium]|nr:acyltransferase family protein [Muribaculaceae bacterium]
MNQRLSNIELLRIISMFFILVVHCAGASLGLPTIMKLEDFESLSTISKEMVESISIIGVNCFILISGYFGIKASLSGFAKFIAICLFYSVSTFLVTALFYPAIYSSEELISTFIIFPNNVLWFVPAYIILYIVSPVINISLAKLSITKLHITVALFSAVILAGWWLELGFNPTGYTAIQLIYIYIIGRWIKTAEISLRIKLKTCIIIYTLATVLIFASTFLLNSHLAFAYNSPFVILASIYFFLIFSKIEVKSSAINSIAKSSLAVYLIHKSPYVWVHFREAVIYMADGMSFIPFTICITLFCIAVFAACIAIDALIFKPVFSTICNSIKITKS